MHERVGRHLAAVVVPFKDDLSIDEPAFRRVCRHVLEVEGIDGIVVNAHAGEVDTLSADERRRLTRITAEEAKSVGKKAVCGILPQPGSYDNAVAMARWAQEDGADLLLLLGPPGFGRGVDMVPEIAGEYTRAVAQSVTIPIIYFTAGALSGINYTPDVIRRICSVDGVVAVKDTMWSPQGFDTNLAMLRKLGRKTAVLSGNDNCVFYNYIAGADGTLLILHCVMALQLIRMFDLVRSNDVRTAKAIDADHEELVRLLFARPMLRMPTRVKHVLKIRGVIPNAVTRPPVPGLETKEAAAIEAELRRLGLDAPTLAGDQRR
jgi:4-hydroxy-tetrahydrodipicolinate synthase